ncbi:MAG: General secretion pathway protein N [Stenotrophomonas maltophilia]|uniref:General secretion pathway protein N n=1 Tax=Stenotrophomonas maltophilia TaxID=40324 RepID=A0A7V8JKL5_STEMA|nr:MAG: General secretion pathway protein N [Stenotrophomonas maltophilia]
MKVEQISLRTWFLVASASWAGALWLATGFGLGQQLPDGSADAAAVTALPALSAAAAERMPGADSYAAIATRPLFAEDRRPRPYQLGGTEASSSNSLRLTGVLLTRSFAMATLTTEQNRLLRLRLNGEAVDGWQLVELQPRQATVIGPGGSQTLQLAVFNGQGGEPPTRLGGSPGSAPGTAPGAQSLPVPPPARPNADTPAAATAGANGAGADAALNRPPPAAAPAQNNGPSEEQMRAIRERIQARRQQLQQQQQQQSQPPGDGGGANR